MRSVSFLVLLAILGDASDVYGKGSGTVTIKQACAEYINTTCESWYIGICKDYCDLYHDQTVYCGAIVQKDINALMACIRKPHAQCFTKESKPPPVLPNPQEPDEPSEPPELEEEEGYIEYDGGKGINGECVWPYIKRIYQANEYSGIGKDVYKAAYYCGTNDVPPNASCWRHDTTCETEAPKILTDEEAVAAAGSSDSPVFMLQPWNAYATSMMHSYEKEVEAMKSQPMALEYRKNIRVLDVDLVEKITIGGKDNPENVKRVEKVFSMSMLEKLFPVRHALYSYQNLIQAVGAFPQICQTYKDQRDSDSQCLKNLGTMFAHLIFDTKSLETTMKLSDVENTDNWNPGALEHFQKDEELGETSLGLFVTMEAGFDESTATSKYDECEDSSTAYPDGLFYPCHSGVSYFGRGAGMIQGNRNYGQLSSLLFRDAERLLKNPSEVSTTWLGYASMFWKFLTPQTPIPSMLWAQDGTWVPNSSDQSQARLPGFGASLHSVDNGVMCRNPSSNTHIQRTHAYVDVALYMQVDIMGEKLTCGDMNPFTDSSAAATKLFWIKDTSGAEKCMISSTPTPFNLGVLGDYKRCVDYHNRSFIIHKGKVVRRNGVKV